MTAPDRFAALSAGRAEGAHELRDTIDPVRRFERDFPEWAAQIAAAADAIAARFGWSALSTA